jgi:hypothetical protein
MFLHFNFDNLKINLGTTAGSFKILSTPLVGVLKPKQKIELGQNLDVLSSSCGASFCDVEDKEDSIFEYVFINNKLTCDSPIEVAYYVVFNDLLCYYCGREHNLPVPENDAECPLCDECKVIGKLTRAKNNRRFKEK